MMWEPHPITPLNARFEHWAAVAYWNLSEAAALSLGLEPGGNLIEGLVDKGLGQAFLDRQQLIGRAMLSGALVVHPGMAGTACFTPAAVLSWLRANNLQFPKELAAALEPPATSGAAGRPSSKHLYEAELKRRFDAGTQATRISQQARDLVAWMESEHPDEPRPKSKAMEDAIRSLFWDLYKRANQTP